jgi:uncharacterized membrane protein YfcA
MKFTKIFLASTLLSLFFFLEVTSNLSYLVVILITGLIGFILSFTPLFEIAKVILTVFCGMLLSYLLFYFIYTSETSTAFNKIKKIPKENLIEYYKTKDISLIPKECRYTWIGFFPRRIDIVSKNRVGWSHNEIFSYYGIESEKYDASFH